MRCPVSRIHTLAAIGLLLFLGGKDAYATAIVRVVPTVESMTVGESQWIEIRADLSLPVLGFGLDIDFDSLSLAPVGSPEIGPLWIPLFAQDGDGLAGLASGEAISGDDILLATLSVQALARSDVSITASISPGELTEGFPLVSAGFDADVHFISTTLTVVPEPGTASLLALSFTLLGAASRVPFFRAHLGDHEPRDGALRNRHSES